MPILNSAVPFHRRRYSYSVRLFLISGATRLSRLRLQSFSNLQGKAYDLAAPRFNSYPRTSPQNLHTTFIFRKSLHVTVQTVI